MSLPASITFLFAVFAVFEARVTFPYSEVLQVNDLVDKATAEATFNCASGCKVYVDRRDDFLQITQNGKLIATFTDIVGNKTYLPDGIVLPAANNYKLISTKTTIYDFVFYVVSVKAPNYGVLVGAPQTTSGVAANGQNRYFTVLSSSNAISYYAISGRFAPGYPKIYAAGFDVVSDGRCAPVFQARTQYNAEQSLPVIFAPIITFDFGYNGLHSASANQNTGKDPYTSNVGSTVFMSPGYVGCSSISSNQLYYSNVKTIADSFTMPVANGLDITAVYSAVAATEPVKFRVNGYTLDFYGTSSFKKSFPYGPMAVDLSWTRLTAASNWAMQLDFGVAQQGSTPRPVATTSSTGSISLFIALFVVAAAAAL